MDDWTLASCRQEYTSTGLHEDDLAHDPFAQFRGWLAQARAAGIWEPNAMVLATAGADAAPSSRMVLLKGLGDDGFRFFTNYESRKGTDLDHNARCSLLFPWHPLERQVRVEGVAVRLDAADSDDYFAARPRGAQVGAWASRQSRVVPDRQALDDGYAAVGARWPEAVPVPRPEYWGGYCVQPEQVEFWQGRSHRMHDR
ncbi:MAG TPA: pyridoxamine 5'-phosphate oxidase, partial [Nocardioidaceae bacterium]|nr:pyridoxamine 5'-phosphate oxidase [Nocardioidaceae bacterium]